MQDAHGAYGASHHIVDYILGITYEIWEEGKVELIRDYYAADCLIYSLDGIVQGAQAVIDGTRGMLTAFPDRLLIAEDVIWSGNHDNGFYSSHRIFSPMTNTGASAYGPATGRSVRLRNIADCVVEQGIITQEWLVRDSLALVTQLGVDPQAAAHHMAATRSDDTRAWFAAEHERLSALEQDAGSHVLPGDDITAFARFALQSAWRGRRSNFDRAFAPYCVMHRTPLTWYSGSDAVFQHYADWSTKLGEPRISVDHVASQPVSADGLDVAVRWTLSGTHSDEISGHGATSQPIFILGVTHWRIMAGRIVGESTVFDELAVLSQVLSR